MRDVHSHEQRAGVIWFFGAGIAALALVVGVYKLDMYLQTNGKREKVGEMMKSVRMAQASLPSAASVDPRPGMTGQVNRLRAVSLNPSEIFGAESHDAHHSVDDHGGKAHEVDHHAADEHHATDAHSSDHHGATPHHDAAVEHDVVDHAASEGSEVIADGAADETLMEQVSEDELAVDETEAELEEGGPEKPVGTGHDGALGEVVEEVAENAVPAVQ